MQGTREKVDTLLVSSKNNVNSITQSGVDVLNNANAKVTALGPTLEKADRTIASLEKSLPPLLQKVDASMDHLEKTTQQLQKASEKAMPRIPKLVSRAEDVVQGADTVLNAVKECGLSGNMFRPSMSVCLFQVTAMNDASTTTFEAGDHIVYAGVVRLRL